MHRTCLVIPLICAFVFSAPVSALSQGKNQGDANNLSGRIAFSSCGTESWRIWSVRPDGTDPCQLTHSEQDVRFPAWSRDARKLAYTDSEGRIWVLEIGKTPQVIQDLPAQCAHPTWSPDGRQIAFVSYSFENGREESDIWIVDLVAKRTWKLMEQPGVQMHPAWSPDGAIIAYTCVCRVAQNKFLENLWLVGQTGKNARPLTPAGFSCIQPDWSPDGEKIAFASDRTGNMDIWVMDRDARSMRALTSDRSFDADPSWSPDGSRICFVSTRTGKMDVWIVHQDGGGVRQVTGLSNTEGESKEPSWGP